MKEPKINYLIGLMIGLLIGISSLIVTVRHYEQQYTLLRIEIINKTDIDISYPKGGCVLNDTIYGGRVEYQYCTIEDDNEENTVSKKEKEIKL